MMTLTAVAKLRILFTFVENEKLVQFYKHVIIFNLTKWDRF